MAQQEKIQFGRKVFFIEPSPEIERNIVSRLFELEYEVYTINSFRKAKAVLKKYPASICFFNIDTSLSYDNWFRFIQSFESDEELADQFIGVYTVKAGDDMKAHFLFNARLPSGFTIINPLDYEASLDTFIGILDINEAKGRRKYVRVDCEDDKFVQLQCKINEKYYDLKVRNISSVGISCYTSADLVFTFKENMLIREVQLLLRGKIARCSVAVLISKIEGENLVLLLLFTKNVLSATKSVIKEYMKYYLQKKMDEVESKAKFDSADYSKSQAKAEMSFQEDAFLVPIENIERYDQMDEIFPISPEALAADPDGLDKLTDLEELEDIGDV